MDEFMGGIVLCIIAVLAILGMYFLAETGFSVTLNNYYWECTESTIVDGKAQCTKYERKKDAAVHK